jgi:poly(3-hydroxybutyrate) depolymerase
LPVFNLHTEEDFMKLFIASAAIMAATLAIGGPAGAQELPSVSILGMTMPDYDPMAGAKMGIAGLFERKIGLDDRTAKLYVPTDTRLGTAMVVLNVPEGEETVQWLADSGWLAVADARQILLYVLEPAADSDWGNIEDERAYFETAYGNISESIPEGRGIYYLPPESYYIVGYDAPGTLLHELAMEDPTLVAASAFVDASDIPASVLAAMDDKIYETPDWNGDEVAASDVPMPVMLVETEALDGEAEAVAAYWMEINATSKEGEEIDGGVTYTQQDGTLDYFVAPSSRLEVTVLENQDRDGEAVGAAAIYDGFLARYTRYGGAAGGNTVGSRPDYDALGVESKTMEVDGRLREYLVYVPEAVKNAGEPAPVVYALHGSGMTMNAMFDYSRWWELADAEGFILAVPAGLNTANRTGWDVTDDSTDIHFISALVEEINASYDVDKSRVYLSGQSNGSAMTHAIGRDLELSANFAALGSTSGGGRSQDTSGNPLPYYLIWGEFDFWPGELATPSEDETSYAVNPALAYWIARNGAEGDNLTPATEVQDGRYETYAWTNEAGEEVVKYTITHGRGHSIIPEEMSLLWNWFEGWRLEDGQSVVATTP